MADTRDGRHETAEEWRLREAREGVPWRLWGPYLSERQWGTVREDYSEGGDAWDSFPHDHARSRSYRWGEDGLAGISDDHQRLCFALALWNGADPILKERLFGLTNGEGNHGEDVKEYYFYLDNVPTHAYMRWLYKYPQAAYPYLDLVTTNRQRSRQEPEYELLDTGVFRQDRYFDVEVEYAKAAPEDLLIRITVHNRGPEAAPLHVLPTLWFRNTWSFHPHTARPRLWADRGAIRCEHPDLGGRVLYVEGGPELLFCENETNAARLWGTANPTLYVKDGVNERIVSGRFDAVNPDLVGTKAAAHVRLDVPPGWTATIRARLAPEVPADPFDGFDAAIEARRREADDFYAAITPPAVDAERRAVMRQALAGMLWTKQYYLFDVDVWLREHQAHPFRPPNRAGVRNERWYHMHNDDVISMPDKWEYPWYAAWDLAFHTLALSMVDPDFSKSQLNLMLSEDYLHPSGQIPAYEWNFGDVNPPVHAWSTLFAYSVDLQRGASDVDFLREAFAKLLVNFTWWINRKDPAGKNVFEGGFLGLDNIGVFDRSQALPTGGRLEQADGTAWMALFSQNMLELALELSASDPAYENLVVKFVEHFFWIAAAMDPAGDHPDELWDETDGFYYDVLRMPDGSGQRIKVRSLVGLLPLCATTVVPAETLERFPALTDRVRRYLERNRDLLSDIADPFVPGVRGRRLLSVVSEDKLRRILTRMLDESRFLSPHGIRSLSRWHLAEPYVLDVDGHEYRVAYEPAESSSGLFGGNSNWRGPVWFPINVLVIRALLQFYLYYGDAFRIECPTASGTPMTLFEVARELTDRLIRIFVRDERGRRPVYGGTEVFQSDPHWKDLVLFYEYFNGDDGAGIGASHQTGWTGAVARMIQLFGHLEPEALLSAGTRPLASVYRAQRSPLTV
jgi:hypothetical protein